MLIYTDIEEVIETHSDSEGDDLDEAGKRTEDPPVDDTEYADDFEEYDSSGVCVTVTCNKI